jgi:hypothetical protein
MAVRASWQILIAEAISQAALLERCTRSRRSLIRWSSAYPGSVRSTMTVATSVRPAVDLAGPVCRASCARACRKADGSCSPCEGEEDGMAAPASRDVAHAWRFGRPWWLPAAAFAGVAALALAAGHGWLADADRRAFEAVRSRRRPAAITVARTQWAGRAGRRVPGARSCGSCRPAMADGGVRACRASLPPAARRQEEGCPG